MLNIQHPGNNESKASLWKRRLNNHPTMPPLLHYNNYYDDNKNTKVSRVFTIHIRGVKYNLGDYKKIISAHTGGIRSFRSEGSS